MYEDLEAGAIDSLAEVKNHVDMNADSLAALNEIKYDTLGEALTGIGRSALVGIFSPFQEKVMPIINEFGSWIVSQMPIVRETSEDVFNAIFDVTSKVFDFFSKNILPVFDELFKFVQNNFPTIKQTSEDVFNAIREVINTVWAFIDKNLLPIYTDLYEWVKSNIPAIRDFFKEAFEKMKVVIEVVWKIIKDNILPIFERLLSWVSSNMPTIKSIVENVFGIMKNVIEAVWDIIENFLLPILKGLVDFITVFIPPIQAIIEGVFDGIFWAVDKVVGIFNLLSSAIEKAVDWLMFWNKSKVEEKTVTVNEVKKTSTTSRNGLSKYAVGTNYHRGGLAIVGERGPELVELPSRSKVKTTNQTADLLAKSSGTTNYITINADRPLSPSEIAREFAKTSRALAYGLR